MTTYRIRRCNGNRDAWLLCRVREDGSESDSYGSYETALDPLRLFEVAYKRATNARDRVEFVPG